VYIKHIVLGIETHRGHAQGKQLASHDRRTLCRHPARYTVKEKMVTTAEKLDKVADSPGNIAGEIGTKFAKVTDTTSQLMDTLNSYRVVLQKLEAATPDKLWKWENAGTCRPKYRQKDS
jgi:hypothetical protein